MSCTAQNTELKADKYLITAEEDAKSEHWATYLHTHLEKRSDDQSVILIQLGNPDVKPDKDVLNIHFEFIPDLKDDYAIEHKGRRLRISVRDDKTAVWIIYQLIENIGMADNHFDTNDLPPDMIRFDSHAHSFDFEYREPHFAPNLQPDYAPLIGTNNVETDWGIWGHNLTKIIEDWGDESIYALVDNKHTKEQFCFSSENVFEQINEYIIDNFGDGSDGYSVRMMIMPTDNKLVCTCPDCEEVGNTPDSATPAVQKLITRLAEKFPAHWFFTSAYLTTFQPPKFQLPTNSGVLFSTINLPQGVKLGQQDVVKEFVEQLNLWREKTPNIYLWDYASNFDDYLTPLPMLLSLQKKLQFFKKQGVKGIFLNAGGYDYSPFDDVKTFVSAALMMDVDANVESLITAFLKKKYPESHRFLTDYYLGLEKQFSEKNVPYNMYGGMEDNLQTYFNAEQFTSFYDALPTLIPTTKDAERKHLEKLFTTLTYTRLQLAYTQGADKWGYARAENNTMVVKPEIKEMLTNLQEYVHFPDLQNYKEFDGSLSEYIEQWQELIKQGVYENALLNVPIELLSEPDEGYEQTELLSDGTPGFTQDYHQGWYLSTNNDLHIRFSTDKLQGQKVIKLRFLQMELHGIYPPEAIEMWLDGNIVKGLSMDKMEERRENKVTAITYSFPLQIDGQHTIELKFKRHKADKSIIAIDEIQILKK